MDRNYENEKDFGDANFQIMDFKSVRKFPHRCVGIIYAYHGNKLFVGTGYLIAGNLVLTVAHNIYSRQSKSYLNNFVFYPGVSERHNQQNGFRVIDWRLPQEYISTQGLDPIKYDYALLKLERHVEGAKFLEMGNNYKQMKEQIGIIGYRAPACDNNTAYQSCLWKSNAHSVQSDGITLRHNLSTHSGNSGSPILVKRGKKHTVIAIHKGAPDKTASFNEARIITDDLLLNVFKWEKQMTDSKIQFCLMTNSDQKIIETDTAKWLNTKKFKLEVITSQLQQLKNTQLEKKKEEQIEVQKIWLEDIVEQLNQIPENEKNNITSLTIKQTCIDDVIQSQFLAQLVGSLSLMKRIINLSQPVSMKLYSRRSFFYSAYRSCYKAVLSSLQRMYLIINTAYQFHYLASTEDAIQTYFIAFTEYSLLYSVIQLAQLLPQLPALNSFTFYFRFYLNRNPAFNMLKESLKCIPEIRLIIDPSLQKYQQPQQYFCVDGVGQKNGKAGKTLLDLFSTRPGIGIDSLTKNRSFIYIKNSKSCRTHKYFL